MELLGSVCVTVKQCSSENCEVLDAKLKELRNLKDHGVYDEVEKENQTIINVRWVITEKWVDGDKVLKARLVAKGYEERLENEIRKDPPTCLKESLRAVMVIAATCQWKVMSLDVRSAFLQGKEIQRSVFLKPPDEAGTDKLWHLKKTIYGLGDASRKWYLKVKETLESLNVKILAAL